MARFTGVCMVAFLLLVAAATVSAYHTAFTATTTKVEIVNPSRCRQQIQGQRLSSCRQYLKYSSRFSPENEGGWREEFPRCCDELERISEQCRCEAVKRVAEQQRQAGGLQGREIREMLRTAESLPGLCRISPQYCETMGGGDPIFYKKHKLII